MSNKIIRPQGLEPETNSICMKSGVAYAQSPEGIVKLTEKCIGKSCKLFCVEADDCYERLYYKQHTVIDVSTKPKV